MAADTSEYLDQLVKTIRADATPALLDSARDYLSSFEPAKLDSNATTNLRLLLDVASRHITGPPGLDMLRSAIARYPPATLTPVHSFAVRHCCQERAYDAAMPFLQNSTTLLMQGHHLHYQDHLLLHFYGALCCIAKQDYERALTLLNLTLAVKGGFTSRIQLEAYRKLILINLILHGNEPALPNTLSSTTKRSLNVLASEYLEVAQQFQKFQTDGVAARRSEFSQHGNAGLLDRAIAALPRHQIKHLSHQYINLSVSDLSTKLSLSQDDTLVCIRSMIAKGGLSAAIDQDGFVCFEDAVISNDAQFERLVGMTEQVNAINARMVSMQKQMELESSNSRHAAKV